MGFAFCEAFASRGCKVYATARDLKKMEGFTDAEIETLALDVTKDEDVRRVVQHIVAAEGKIDVVVNNAGISYISKSDLCVHSPPVHL
jgi:1-acylglycerone phosphate reductase